MVVHNKVNNDVAEHYTWGQGCEGWYLVNTPQLTVIQERMPAQTAEQYHRHRRAQQYFYVLSGEATFDIDHDHLTVGSGEGIRILPGSRHKIVNQTAQELLFIVTSQPSTAGDREELIESDTATSSMRQATNVLDCYGKTAEAYADAFAHELAYKPLDRLLLTRFAEENLLRGSIIDLGCGPGQTTAFLHQAGLTEVVGMDLSPAMVAVARQRNGPTLSFEVADMLQLPYAAQAFGGAVAFYSIVHLTMYELALAFEEIHRVLKPQSSLLLAFHALPPEDGQRAYPHTDYLGQPVEVTFYLFDPDEVRSLAIEAGFVCTEALVRYPYAEEYPSKRAYLLFTKP